MFRVNILAELMKSLKDSFGLSFGHMVVFKDNKYCMVSSDPSFQEEYLNSIEHSSIFCSRNITGAADHGYNFTLWPDKPSDAASTMCFKHDQWHGITISKAFKDCTALWWFGTSRHNQRAQDFYVRHKHFLVSIIQFFNSFKNCLNLPDTSKECTYTFTKGFDIGAITDQQTLLETLHIRDFLLRLDHKRMQHAIQHSYHDLSSKPISNLSLKEIQILSFLSQGFSAKLVAQHVNRSYKTVEHHIANIKSKLELRYKADLIKFYTEKVKSESMAEPSE